MTTIPHDARWVAAAAAEVLGARHDSRSVRAVPATGTGIETVTAHRLVPLLAPHAEALGAPAPVAEALQSAHRRVVRTGLARVADTVEVSRLLATADVAHLVCKGAALDALLGHAPGTRGQGDVDVWVASRDVDRAARTLVASGWERRPSLAASPRPEDGWWWRVLLWGGKELPYDRSGRATVDLHWRLTNGRRHLSFDFGVARDSAVTVELAGESVPTLDPARALEHMAAHGRKEAWPYLRQVVDIVELTEHLGPERTAEIAKRRAEVAGALGVAAHLAPWLRDVARLDRAASALASEAWRGCLALDRRYHVRMALRGTAAWRASLRHEWWLFRSAPDWRTRVGYDTRLALWAVTHARRQAQPALVPRRDSRV